MKTLILLLTILISLTTYSQINTPLATLTLTADNTYLYAGTTAGVFRSSDKGSTWKTVNTGLLNTPQVYVLYADLPHNALWAGTDDGLFKSYDHGDSWIMMLVEEVNCMYISADTIYVGTFRGGLYRSVDGGTTWSQSLLAMNIVLILPDYILTGTGINSPLPVELTVFTAIAVGTYVHLTWQTATETNNYGFDLERNTQKIAFIPGAGTSNIQHTYTYTDNPKTASMYRLKQIDRDGNFHYSKVVTAATKATFAMQVYPNPFTNQTTILYSIPQNGLATLQLYNVLGQLVHTMFDNTPTIQGTYLIPFTTTYASGVYFLRLIHNNNAIVNKIIIVR